MDNTSPLKKPVVRKQRMRKVQSANELKVFKLKKNKSRQPNIVCPIPLPRPPQITAWSILDEEHAQKIKKCPKSIRLQIIRYVCEKLFEGEKEQSIMRKLFYEVLRFALKRNYEPVKISTLFGVYYITHSFFTSSLWHDYQETYEFFKEAVFVHSINDPPESVQIFSIIDIQDILERFTTMYLPVLPLLRVNILPNVRLVMTWKGWKEEKEFEDETKEQQLAESFEMSYFNIEGLETDDEKIWEEIEKQRQEDYCDEIFDEIELAELAIQLEESEDSFSANTEHNSPREEDNFVEEEQEDYVPSEDFYGID